MKQVTVVEATSVRFPEEGPIYRAVVPQIEAESNEDRSMQEFGVLLLLDPDMVIEDFTESIAVSSSGERVRWGSEHAPMIELD